MWLVFIIGEMFGAYIVNHALILSKIPLFVACMIQVVFMPGTIANSAIFDLFNNQPGLPKSLGYFAGLAMLVVIIRRL